MDEVRWISPPDALAAGEAGELEISFPTIRNLEQLRDYPDADAVIEAAASRVVEPILPKVVGTRESFEVLLPGDPRYPAD